MRKLNSSMMIILVFLLVFSPIIPALETSIQADERGSEVGVWVTDGDESRKLEKVESALFQDDELTPNVPLAIAVDERETYQEMDGFGAALSGSSAHVIQNLPEANRHQLLSELFGNDVENNNFSFLRITMGASDFNTSRFTYNDMPLGETDPHLENFSIEEDTDVIAVIQEILEINPDLKILASPWSAPAWMKTPETLNGGQLNPEYYEAYANYFVKFIEGYKEEGINIYAVTVQNEPHHESGDGGSEYGYPTMRMTASAQADFVKNHLGPTFKANNIETNIIIWDHNWNEPEYPLEILEEEGIKEYIDGTAFHCYAGDVRNQSQINDLHPDKGIWFTECSGGDWSTNFGENIAWNMSNIVIGSIRNWSKSVLLWNLALDENAGPITPPENEDDERITGGCSDCRGVVTIDSETDEITRNEEYYILGHVSKFVHPGAKRIESSDLGTKSIENVAFINPDGSKALIAMNSTGATQEFKVRWGSQSFVYELDAGSVATFVWSGVQSGNSVISGYSKIEAENYDFASKELKRELTNDIGGGYSIGDINSGDYIKFDNIHLDKDMNSVQARVATAWDSGIEFRVGGPEGHLIGTVEISNTGGWYDWKTITAPVDVTGVEGVHDLYLVFQGPVNANWFQISNQFFQDTLNYIKNPSFETGAMTFWSEWKPGGQDSSQSVTTGDARSGSYKVDHWLGEDYMQSTYQTVKVPNGTYSYSVWVRSSGDQEELRLEAKNFGGDAIYKDLGSDGIGSWTKFTIDDIYVSNGQVEIGVFSNANGGNWANFDDFSLQRVTKKAPTSASGNIIAPQGLVAEVDGASRIHLNWDSVEGATGYKVYRSSTINDQTSDYVERSISSGTELTDYGLFGETTYNYVVTAYNAEGESEVSEVVTFTTEAGVDTIAPAIPTGFTGEAKSGGVKLYWENNVDFDFLKYNIYMDGERTTSVNPVTETGIEIGALQSGQEYSFTITAEDIFGNESPESEAFIVTPTVIGFVVDLPNMSFETGDLEHWDGNGTIDNDLPRTGSYKLTHSVEDGELYTYRVEDVPNGEYKISVWVRSGDLEALQLTVKNYGGDVLTQNMFSNSWDVWTPFSIDRIEVTNGQIEFGVFSKAGSSQGWAGIDDFELISFSELDEDGREDDDGKDEDNEEEKDIDEDGREDDDGKDEDNEEEKGRDEEVDEEKEGEQDKDNEDLKEKDSKNKSKDWVSDGSIKDTKDDSSDDGAKKDEKLPDTNTNTFNDLLAGLALVLVGATILYIKKRRNSSQPS